MSGPFGSSQWMYASGAEEEGQSLRFDDNGSAYLNRTPSSAGNRQTWTWSGWVKRGNLGEQDIFGDNTASSSDGFIKYRSDNVLQFGSYVSGYNFDIRSSAVYRDVSAWYHIVAVYDSSNSTSSLRQRLYVNGEEVSYGTQSNSSQNYETKINNNVSHSIGHFVNSGSIQYLDGYLSNIHFIDGQALDPTSFGETIDGYWKAKNYSGSYGTNGFHLEFDGDTTDSSGNGNNWTANNISAHDYVPDSPTNNFATLNPLNAVRAVGIAEGNLRYSSQGASGANAGIYAGTISWSSGKWYFEFRLRSGNVDLQGGIVALPATPINGSFETWRYKNNGYLEFNGGATSGWATTYSTGDVIGIAVDSDNGTFKAYKNGTLVGTKTGISTTKTWVPRFEGYNIPIVDVNFGQDSTFAGATSAGGNQDDNGIGDFKYAPPSGYLALCTDNLPEPTIVDGSEYFNTVLYSGNGADRNIDVGFKSNFVWVKERNNAPAHRLYDSIRGDGQALFSNLTNAEYNGVNDGIHFDYADGFNIDVGINVNSYNGTNDSYVAWNWKAGGTASSNTSGSITSQVLANTDAGFSIVTYSGNGSSSATVGHGLGVVPSMLIVKRRNTAGYGWNVYHPTIGASKVLFLSSTVAESGTSLWNSTAPTSSVFSLGTSSGANASGGTYVGYCFAEVDGYSKAGSYTGNGSTDGPFVYTGFRPAWVMLKRTNSAEDWVLVDSTRSTFNDAGHTLFPNLSDTENNYTSGSLDLVSNGFKLRNSGGLRNGNGDTYIYLAFAETPFKYANAR